MRLLSLATLLAATLASAQVPVPFNSGEDRFMVLANGRFEKMEPRPPKAVYPMDGQVVYEDHEGRLRIFIAEGRRLHALEGPGTRSVKATRQRIAWLHGDTLRTVRGGETLTLATGVARFSVGDGLIVYHDSVAQELRASGNGTVTTLATIERGSARPQWMQGDVVAVFFTQANRRLFGFRDGTVKLLCDSTDAGNVYVGSDRVAYWDDRGGRFTLVDASGEHELSGLRPVSAKAGRGLVAWVDGAGGLRCHAKGRMHVLTDTIPTDYWVRDGLLLFLRGNALHLFDGERTLEVERYVPELWRAEGTMLVYLDINRELRGIVDGERVRFGNEASIPTFELYGDAVLYTSPTGLVTVVRKGRTYTF